MMQQNKFFLGVDGGATKTLAVVIDTHGRVLGHGHAGPSNYRDAGGNNAAVRNVLTASRGALRAARVRPAQLARSGFGISGLDNDREFRAFRQTLRRNAHTMLGKRHVVVNDVIAGFRSGSDAPFGACVIAGTGSNAFARGRDGTIALAGGIGPVFSDDGGAKEIGRAVLRAAARSADGRMPTSLLERLVCTKLGVRSIRDATHIANGPDFTSERIATFSPLADQAARRGDAEARRILRGAAEDLAHMATTVIRCTLLTRLRFDLVLVGTVLGVTTVLQPTFKRLVRTAAPRVRFVRPRRPFAVGAALLARDA